MIYSRPRYRSFHDRDRGVEWRQSGQVLHLGGAALRHQHLPRGVGAVPVLRWRLLAVPARLVRHARGLTLRLPPGHHLLAEVLARVRTLPHLS